MDLAEYVQDYTTSQLIASGNYKQAIKNIDKKLKKSADDPQALSLKANLLLVNGDLQGSQTICTGLLTRKPTIVDHSSLELTFYNLCELRRLGCGIEEQDLETLWQNAIKAQRSANQKFLLTRKWGSQSIRHGQWQQVTKASMVLQKSSDRTARSQRNFWFWQTTARYLAGQSAVLDRVKSVQRDLVLRMLEMAARDTPETPESPDNFVPCIVTAQELRLLLEILYRENQHRSLVEILETPKFEIISGNDYTFEYAKSRSLVKLEDDKAASKWAAAALENAMNSGQDWLLDDWCVWSCLINFTRVSETSIKGLHEAEDRKSILNASELVVKKHSSSRKSSRAPQLASLILNWQNVDQRMFPQGSDSRLLQSERLEICLEHLKQNINQLFVVKDLQDKFTGLGLNELFQLRTYIGSFIKMEAPTPGLGEVRRCLSICNQDNQMRWIIAETNALSLDYKLLQRKLKSSKPGSRDDWLPIMRAFIENCLGIYRISRMQTVKTLDTDAKFGDYSCILAVKALILLHSEFQVAVALIQGACLLGFLLASSRSNFKARIEHIKLLTCLGLPSSAWESFQRLDVKEILSESLCPLMFTRISTLNPQSLTVFDPRAEMEKPLEFYKKSLSKFPKYQELALESENFAHVIQIEDLARRIDRSPTRWMLGLERRRISRFRGLSYDSIDKSFDPAKRPKSLNFFSLSTKSRNYAESHLGSNGCVRIMLLAKRHQAYEAYKEPYLDYLRYIDSLSEAIQGFSEPKKSLSVFEVLSDPYVQESLLASSTLKPAEAALVLPSSALALLARGMSLTTIDLSTLLKNLRAVSNTMQTVWDEQEVQNWDSYCREHIIPNSDFYNSCYNGLELFNLCHKVADRVVLFINTKGSREAAKLRQHCQEEAYQIKKVAKGRSHLIYRTIKLAQAQLPQKDRALEAIFGSNEATDGTHHGSQILEVMGLQSATDMSWDFIMAARMSLDAVLNVKLG